MAKKKLETAVSETETVEVDIVMNSDEGVKMCDNPKCDKDLSRGRIRRKGKQFCCPACATVA